jgi:HK97 family phage prohead protease
MAMVFDFSGWATKNDLLCADGRTIRRDAFADNDGDVVPLVWQHGHSSPENVIGHALLQNKPDGVYAYGVFNDTENGQHAKALVKHGDITALSIYANQLKQNGGNVIHGNIREVSLVIAGANPGASIEHVMAHGTSEGECAVVYNDDFTVDTETLYEMYDIDKENELSHSDEYYEEDNDMNERSVKDVYDEMTDEQKAVVMYMVGEALEEDEDDYDDYDDYDEDDEDDVEHGYYDMEGDYMKANVFDTDSGWGDSMSHAAIQLYEDKDAIFADAKRLGSFKDSVLSHAATYGIDNIDYLFPDPKNITDQPGWIKREDEWVTRVMNAVTHSPFSRIKSMFADITADEARAKGYTKGNKKLEEVFTLLKRVTTPTTVYKKQKIDRDDELDIIDFDVISWIKVEMRGMLNEEIARAILIGDGRSPASNDKINENNIRPILTDDDLFTVKVPVSVAHNADEETVAKAIIRSTIKSRKLYKGSGNPVLFTTDDWLTDMLLLEDGVGRKLYKTVPELATALRVKDIITVPVMENVTRTFTPSGEVTSVTRPVIGIIVNLADYRVGSDKGGQISMFDDFDIDYNQKKYLMEARMSGALVKPYSAMVLELDRASE